MRSAHRKPRTALATTGAALLILALCACTSGTPSTAPSGPNTGPTTTATPTHAPDPQLAPQGAAADNKSFFDFVNTRTIAASPSAGGKEITSALRDAGFSLADMQVTVDTTTVGVKADSVQFSVFWKGQCLVGQYGFGSYASVVMPALGTGKCLVGETRTIDW